MILIADSGSTKTHWILAAADGALQSCVTRGINPFFLDKPAIINLLETEFMLPKEAIAAVYFYGAGCTPETIPGVIDALGTHFQSDTIEVHSDMLAAAHSLSRKEEGIVCILGTGSNSCYYDGEKIIDNVYSLGYVLGDEGSGAVLGKKLIADILRGTSSPKHSPLEPATVQDFFATYPYSPAELMDNVYRESCPNRFLAQFVPFIVKHLSELQPLVEQNFDEFIVRNVLKYDKVRELPVHFTGSIAFHFQPVLKKVLNQHGLQTGRITQTPMPDLIQYYTQKN